jgi:hypothetical protein
MGQTSGNFKTITPVMIRLEDRASNLRSEEGLKTKIVRTEGSDYLYVTDVGSSIDPKRGSHRSRSILE